MAVMGSMDENLAGKKAPEGSVYNEWHEQWKVLDERLEELDPMPRADMLFDGKVTINAITGSDPTSTSRCALTVSTVGAVGADDLQDGHRASEAGFDETSPRSMPL